MSFIEREIIHRIWIQSEKRMIYSPRINDTKNTMTMWMDSHNHGGDACMAYTGKDDVNGKRIFEGDIVSCVFRGTGVVVFKGSCFQLITKGNWQYVGRLIKPTVMGNIYENPDIVPVEMHDMDSFMEKWNNGRA